MDVADGKADRPVGSEIELVNLTRSFGEVTAVKRVSLKVTAGEFLTLLGPSGSGKTTLLMMIAGFVTPSEGDVQFDGKSVIALPPYRRNLGVVFQNYALFPHLSVFENIAFPLRLRHLAKTTITREVTRVLEIVGLPRFEERLPHQLSGGQQQRVALARALVFNPSALLMDEPLGALDKKLRIYMQDEIRRIQQRLKITTIYVTHDQDEAMIMSDRIAVLNEGLLQQVASPQDLHARPANAFIADFLGGANFLRARLTTSESGTFVAVTQKGLRVVGNAATAVGIGSEVLLLLRPEGILILSSEEVADNTSNGVVEDVVFLGSMIRCLVRLEGGDILSVIGTSPMLAKKAKLKGRVKVGWSADNVSLVPESPEQTEGSSRLFSA
jgi:spermidine/putrescine ABC transporter ATP-binding subunit